MKTLITLLMMLVFSSCSVKDDVETSPMVISKEKEKVYIEYTPPPVPEVSQIVIPESNDEFILGEETKPPIGCVSGVDC